MRNIVSATARAAGLSALGVTTLMEKPASNRDWDPTISEYFIVCPDDLVDTIAEWFPEVEEDGRVVRQLFRSPEGRADPRYIWTDDRHATIRALELNRFLFRAGGR